MEASQVKATKRRFEKCPRCKSQLEPAECFVGGPSSFWLECIKCNTFVDTYVPMAHQESVHLDTHRLIGNFGGYGTGKSLTDYKDLIKHLLITPSADAMVTANISYQYEQTVKKELERDIPKAFVEDYSVKNQNMVLKNKASLSYRPLDDPNKLRSNNLTYFLIVEGSETGAESFHQLKTRLRNTNATVPELDENGEIKYDVLLDGTELPRIKHDWRKGIVESNPDAGWIRTDMLLVSDKIHQHGKNNDEYEVDALNIDKRISTHITTTDANVYLPKDYIEMICKNKPEWWVNRYVNSSFLYSEGLVYPSAIKNVVSSFSIPQDWKRIVAFDYGLRDNACFVLGTIDPNLGILYIYKEYVTNNRNVEELAKAFKEITADIPIGGWITQPIMDPKNNKRDYNKKDLATHFAELGIMFKPGHVSLDARILRTNTYIESKKVYFFDTVNTLLDELREYKFEERTLDNRKRSVKPVDKNNHCINPLEWIIMELPANPLNLMYGVYTNKGFEVDENKKALDNIPWQLRDDYEEEGDLSFDTPIIDF